jgi:KipI family sensor histidine kinase inhibitor
VTTSLVPAARIEPLGERGLIIELGTSIDPAVNRRVIALAGRIRAAALEGVVDVVPSFAAVGVHFHPEAVRLARGETAHSALARHLRTLIDDASVIDAASSPEIVDIPVCYGGVHGPDLDEAARLCKLDPAELVAIHQQPEAEPISVYMIGFAPGAPYIGLHDARLSLPRRSTPRIAVPAGTVAIANRQSVVYPFTGPGGWNLIGRTPLTLFDARRDPPGLLSPGVRIRFRAIEEAELQAWPKGAP